MENPLKNLFLDRMGLARNMAMKPGIVLINAPTGTGKSYAMQEACAAFMQEWLSGKRKHEKIFCITPQKKDIRDIANVSENGPRTEGQQKGLFLESRYVHILEFFDSKRYPRAYLSKLGFDESFLDLLEKLDQKVHAFNVLSDKDKERSEDAREYMDVEYAVRSEINGMIREEAERIVLKKDDEELTEDELQKKVQMTSLSLLKKDRWRFVTALYPECLVPFSPVICCSVAKFCMGEVKVPYSMGFLWELYKEDGSVNTLFMDEFDYCEQAIRDWIIHCSVSRYRLLDIHRSLSGFLLSSPEFPADIFGGSKGQALEYKEKKLRRLIRRLEKTREDYKLDRLEKRVDTGKDSRMESFLFSPLFMVYLKRGFAYYVYNPAKGKNEIYYGKGKEDAEKIEGTKFRLGEVLYRADRDIVAFERFINSTLLTDFVHHANQMEKNHRIYSANQGRVELYELFGLDPVQMTTLRSLYNTNILKRIHLPYQFDTFYDSIPLLNYQEYDDSHIIRSILTMVRIPFSAEKVLTEWATHHRIFGLSATAGIPTVLRNFDLNFLNARNLLHPLTKEEEKSLTDFYEKRFDCGGVTYHPRFLSGPFLEKDSVTVEQILQGDKKDLYLSLFGENLYKEANLPFFGLEEEKMRGFFANRRYRLAKSMEAYLTTPSAHGMLILTNRGYNTTDTAFRNREKEEMERLFMVLYKKLKKEGRIQEKEFPKDPKEVLTFLTGGAGFQAGEKKFKEDLAKGYKAIVFSAIQTAARAINLQSTSPYTTEFVRVNHAHSMPGEEKIDCNWIYLESPRNLIPYGIYGQDGEERRDEFLTKAYTVGKLYEHISQSEITLGTLREAWKDLALWRDNEDFNPNSWELASQLRGTPSYHLGCLSILLQSLGRITRSQNRYSDVYLDLDDHWLYDCDWNWGDKTYLLPEYRAIQKAALSEIASRKIQEDAGRTPDLLNGMHDSNTLASRIRGTLIQARQTDLPLSKEAAGSYKVGRLHYLLHPTLKGHPVMQNWMAQYGYMRVPVGTKKYWYKQYGDYSSVEILLKEKPGYREVSAEDARLSALWDLPGMTSFLEEKGIARSFFPPGEDHDHILNPKAYNIYLGMLGESAVEAYLSMMELGQVKELPQEFFEFFDFVIGDIGIDAKHWNGDIKDAKGYEKKIEEKLEKSGLRKALIINVLDPGDQEYVMSEGFEGRVLRVPYLARNGNWDRDVLYYIRKFLET